MIIENCKKRVISFISFVIVHAGRNTTNLILAQIYYYKHIWKTFTLSLDNTSVDANFG